MDHPLPKIPTDPFTLVPLVRLVIATLAERTHIAVERGHVHRRGRPLLGHCEGCDARQQVREVTTLGRVGGRSPPFRCPKLPSSIRVIAKVHLTPSASRLAYGCRPVVQVA